MNIVTQIELNQRGNRRSGIKRLHGLTDGKQWDFAESQMIDMINGVGGQSYTFWVLGRAGVAVRVVVAGNRPNQFLKTEADGIGANNLLSLPEWPSAA